MKHIKLKSLLVLVIGVSGVQSEQDGQIARAGADLLLK